MRYPAHHNPDERTSHTVPTVLAGGCGTAVGITVLTLSPDAQSVTGLVFAVALTVATSATLAAPIAILYRALLLRIGDRRAERSLPITDDLVREIAALVNAGRVRKANRLTRRAVDPQAAAFAAFRYIDVD